MILTKVRAISFLLFLLILTPTSSVLADDSKLTPSSQDTNPFTTISNIFDGFNSAPNKLLEAEQAFKLSAQMDDTQNIQLSWQIADGYYLYRDKIKLNLEPDTIKLSPVIFPAGTIKQDEIFGRTLVYYQHLTLTQGLLGTPSDTTEIKLTINFQGCAEIGVCYPPMSKTVLFTLLPSSQKNIASNPTVLSDSQSDEVALGLAENSFWLTTLIFLGSGLLLSFTPCVFPMIPILSGIIIGHGKGLTTRKAFFISLSYVLASALTYAGFGILAGLFGENLQASFQNPWILSSFSIIFVLLALSMFGLYPLQLPGVFQNKISQLSQHQKRGSLLGAAIMGILSTLIVGPCVAAPLAGILIYIGQTGDAILGGLALFSMGLGMGIPLVLIGISAGKYLPKAGHWMEPIKYFFGVLLLAVAIWLMQRILPASIVLLLWAALLIISAVYLKATDPLPSHLSGWQKLSKGIGVLFLIYGIILMLGAASGGSNPLKPLENLGASTNKQIGRSSLTFQPIKNVEELNRVLTRAQQKKQPVMLDFYADWCISCKEMETLTFSNPQVKAALKNTLLLQIDVTKNTREDRNLLKKFNLVGPPAILLFNHKESLQTTSKVIGFMAPEDFLKRLEKHF